jgi:hypothetical protein
MVVFPELSKPMIIIFNYFLPLSFEKTLANIEPINLIFDIVIIIIFIKYLKT